MTRPDIPIFDNFPKTTAVMDIRTRQRLSRVQMADRILSRRYEIEQMGLADGSRIVIGRTNPIDYILDIFACWSLGLCVVAVNPKLTETEQRRVVVTTDASAWLGRTEVDMPPSASAPQGVEKAALILMTSGTTGNPKGVMLSLGALEQRLKLNVAEIGPDPLAHSLCLLPIFFGHGLIGNCLTPLLAGGTVYFWPSPSVPELPKLADIINENRITFLSSVPTFWKMALHLSPKPKTSLERIHIGSAPLSYPLWQKVAAWSSTDAVYNMFGMTETANWMAGGLLAEAGAQDGFVGRPWGGEIAVLGDDGKQHGSGIGEVLVKSPTAMMGLWNRPEATKAAFIDGWFRTGDIGLIQNGALTLKGRIKSEINRAGLKIQAEEIDLLLERHPDIAEACAFGIDDALSGEVLGAAIVANADQALDLQAIRDWCRDHVRAEAVPEKLFQMASIPRNDRGKLVRHDVKAALGIDEDK